MQLLQPPVENLWIHILKKLRFNQNHQNKPSFWRSVQMCPKSCCSQPDHLRPAKEEQWKRIHAWFIFCSYWLCLRSNLFWLVFNAGKRWRSSIHWRKCNFMMISWFRNLFSLFFNYFLFLYFIIIPDAASKAALSTNPYWRFLTHSA